MHYVIYATYYCTCPEQEIDGEAAIDLAGVGGLDQLIACGLKSVCSQLKFKRLAKPSTLAAQSKESYVADNKGCKLKMTELKNLPPEEKRVYLTMSVISHDYICS